MQVTSTYFTQDAVIGKLQSCFVWSQINQPKEFSMMYWVVEETTLNQFVCHDDGCDRLDIDSKVQLLSELKYQGVTRELCKIKSELVFSV